MITLITLEDDGQSWITISAEIDAPAEPSVVRLAWAEAYAERYDCPRITATWRTSIRAA